LRLAEKINPKELPETLIHSCFQGIPAHSVTWKAAEVSMKHNRILCPVCIFQWPGKHTKSKLEGLPTLLCVPDREGVMRPSGNPFRYFS